MKAIRTLHEPTPGLHRYREAAGRPSWPGFRHLRRQPAYRELRSALVRWQHGLCAYCEAEIQEDRCQIEHVIPRSDPKRGRERELDITNLVACCLGGADPDAESTVRADESASVRIRETSCGQSKGDRMFAGFVDPRTLPASPSLFRVDPGGRMETDEVVASRTGKRPEDAARTLDLLNLNAARLRRERRRRWESLLRRAAIPGAAREREAWVRIELLPDEAGRLHEFFTTGRSFFGPLAERILAVPPPGWI